MSGNVNLSNNGILSLTNSGKLYAFGEDSEFYINNEIVGTIIASALSESQMGDQSSDYYYCDGRSCSGTIYESVTGNSSVPDLRGQFLRGLDSTGTVDPNGASRTLLDEQEYKTGLTQSNFTTNTTGAHTHQLSRDSNELGGGDNKYRGQSYNGSNNQQSTSAGNHSHTITGGGDNDTNPINISINFFIKVK